MRRPPSAAIGIAIAIALAGCSGSGGNNGEPYLPNTRPDFLRGTILSATYDGVTDDLLTAGLGRSGLAGAAPSVAAPASPTVAELRRLAIYNNYRALVDITAAGGYGSLYGPNVDAAGNVTAGEGRIAGEEHIAYADDGTGRQNVTLMVQIPANFDRDNPCIVSATSSGSRGVYGAIATAGEWGLKRGCAVAYTDKGSGNGGHDLAANAVHAIQGTRTGAAAAGAGSIFTAELPAADLASFNAAFPNRWAYKHAHSRQNPERDWGLHTLQAIRFAFYQLNQKYGTVIDGATYQRILPENTLVIASSVSNGAGAALAAAEQDTAGLIDGVAVAEPQVQVAVDTRAIGIRRGLRIVPVFGKTLYDYFTIANLYQPCAAYAAAATGSPGQAFVNATASANRCAALAAAELIAGATPAEQAAAAFNKLREAGWEPESDLLHASHYAFATLSVTLTYANSYARASVKDNLCAYSFGGAPVGGVPSAISATAAAQLFGTGNGVPPTGGINILNNASVGGAAIDAASVSPGSGVADLNAEGARCLRGLLDGTGAQALALRAGIEEVKRTGNLRGKPAVIVHGRSDTLIPVNHTSRPYYAMNKVLDTSSRLAYYEITNAQHFDAFIGNALLAGYDTRLVPLHRYFNQAMDLVYANLRNGTPLPPSQVVRTTPRGGTPGAAPAITAANVPPIAASPAAGDTITFANGALSIPD